MDLIKPYDWTEGTWKNTSREKEKQYKLLTFFYGFRSENLYISVSIKLSNYLMNIYWTQIAPMNNESLFPSGVQVERRGRGGGVGGSSHSIIIYRY